MKQTAMADGCVLLELPVKSGGEAAPFDLEAAVCSHGMFMMAPNRWDAATRTFHRPLRLSSSPSTSLPVRISHHPSPSHPSLLVSVHGASSLSSQDQQFILEQVRRMLRLSEEDDRIITQFHELHKEAKKNRFGRIFRSPTLFEDMVKCILLCNCQWPRSLSMARALCELQLELKHSTCLEDFQPKTPQPREHKRKRSEKKNVQIKLETKFAEDDIEPLKDSKPKILVANNIVHLETKETSCSLSSDASETNSKFDSSDLSELSSSNASYPTDQIGDFPTPEELATPDMNFFAKHCALGYRAERIVLLARSIVEGKIHLGKFEEICEQLVPSTYEKLDEELSGIYGFGPFTRANVLMCMGFFHKIPADTETIRHLKQFHNRKTTIHSVREELDAIYGKHAPFQFLVYWFELWGFYDKQFGKISEMLPSDYQLFTASKLKGKKRKTR